MRKWIEIRVIYDDGWIDVWTPERLEKVKSVASELVEMIMRSAKTEYAKKEG